MCVYVCILHMAKTKDMVKMRNHKAQNESKKDSVGESGRNVHLT